MILVSHNVRHNRRSAMEAAMALCARAPRSDSLSLSLPLFSSSSGHTGRLHASPAPAPAPARTRIARPFSTAATTAKQNQARDTARSPQPTIKIVEVGPRDGLQNEPPPIVSVKDKVELIRKLERAGCSNIEVGAFVSPKWIPQMVGSSEVLNGLRREELPAENAGAANGTRARYSVLVPNLRGLEQALADGTGVIDEIAIFGAASEEFTKRNINSTIDKSFERFRAVVDRIRDTQHNNDNDNDKPLLVRGYVSTVIACPYQGAIEPNQVARVVEQMLELGCHEVSLGDTIGVGTPLSTRNMLDEVLVRAGVLIGLNTRNSTDDAKCDLSLLICFVLCALCFV